MKNIDEKNLMAEEEIKQLQSKRKNFISQQRQEERKKEKKKKRKKEKKKKKNCHINSYTKSLLNQYVNISLMNVI